jgi:hemolysin III
MTAVTTTASTVKLRPHDLGKPRMRGLLHTYAFFVAAVAGIVLCAFASTRPAPWPIVSCGVYSLTVCGLFGVSALYHRKVWSHRAYQAMKRLDHSMIFIFIAGTYTPFSVLLLPEPAATTVLCVVWGGAILGVGIKLIWTHAPRWIGALLYIALGWTAALVIPDFLRSGGITVLVLLAAGGVAYTAGAVLYALRRPNPWPTVFGHHEFFHACTLVAATCHHVALYFALFGAA